LNTDTRKFETSQKEESRAQSADSSKAYRKPSRAFNCSLFVSFLLFQPGKNRMQLNCRVKRCGVKNQNRRQEVLNRGLGFVWLHKLKTTNLRHQTQTRFCHIFAVSVCRWGRVLRLPVGKVAFSCYSVSSRSSLIYLAWEQYKFAQVLNNNLISE